MIAKRAQQRVLLKTSPKWLSVKSANTPSQTRVPSSAAAAVAAAAATARTRVPRDEQWTFLTVVVIVMMSVSKSQCITRVK